MDDLHANDRSNSLHASARDVLPFSQSGASADPSAPTFAPNTVRAKTGTKPRPVPKGVTPRLSEDSIQNAEAALALVDRRLANLRKLLGEDSPDQGPRAA
jgi:hypothetical protein